ncbi:hypothetical protein FOZ62_014122, partial [Perkinsus olseni]
GFNRSRSPLHILFSAMVDLVDASPSEANLRALSNHKEGRMYEVPPNDCRGGCGCRTDSQIVLYGEHGEVSAAVCAQICYTTDNSIVTIAPRLERLGMEY